MTADQFLDLVENTGLLERAELAAVRRQLATSDGTIFRDDQVAAVLVRKNLLTKNQAQRLLKQAGAADQAADGQASAGVAKPVRSKDKPAGPKVPAKRPVAEEEELGLAPLDDEPGQGSPAQEEEIVQLEPAPGSRPVVDRGLMPLDAVPGRRVAEVSGLRPLEDLHGLKPLDDSGLEPLSAGLMEIHEGTDWTEDRESLGSAAEPTRTLGKPFRVDLKKARWDWTLVLVCGGGLLVLGIIALGLFFLLRRGTAADLYAAADEAYKAGSYSDAVEEFSRFGKKFPNDENASAARVKIATAQLWQANKGGADKRQALKVANELLPTVEKEAAFPDCRGELASLLPDIAEGFASQANAQTDITKAQELVRLAQEAMKLVNAPSYIPSSLRKSVEDRIDAIEENVDRANRTIRGSRRLTEALAAIQKATAEAKTAEAFALRRALLREHPELEAQPALLTAMRAIADKERTLVKVVDQVLAPQQQDHPVGSQLRVVLASRRGPAEPGSDHAAAFFLARGAVYGLQASTGRLLWRRFVGTETVTVPQTLPGRNEGLIALDERRNELVRLKGDTGELVWRLPVGEPCLAPVVEGTRLLVATQSGKILVIDAKTGGSAKHVMLPQPLAVPPAVDRGRLLYQLGSHSNLYVLDAGTLECKSVYYLGHKAGTIATPPVIGQGIVAVAVNGGTATCDLHILAGDGAGGQLKPVKGSPLRLSGHVVTAPRAVASRLVVVTDLGAVVALEINAAKPDEPIRHVVEPVAASRKTPLAGYCVAESGRCWVAGEGLTQYELQTATKKMIAKWTKCERDTFVAAPQLSGKSLLHIRRRHLSPSFTVTAMQAEDGQVLWEVDLATPLVQVTADSPSQQIHAISAQAELFDVTPETLKSGTLDQPAASAAGAGRTVPFGEVLTLTGGGLALASAYDRSQLVLYNPQSPTPAGRLEARNFAGLGDARGVGPVVAIRGGVLTPLAYGQLAVMDPATGRSMLAPLQTSVELGKDVEWRRAAVIGDGQEFVIADNRRQLLRIGLQNGPPPALAQLARVELPFDIHSPLATSGDTVYAVVRDPASDKVVSFAAGDLAAGNQWPVKGRVVWGPEAIGELVLAATDRGQLLCFEAGQKQRWTAELAYGPLAGRPLVLDGDLVLTAIRGVIWRLAGADGTEVSKLEFGEPLGLGAVAWASQLIVSGSDGTLHVFPALAGKRQAGKQAGKQGIKAPGT